MELNFKLKKYIIDKILINIYNYIKINYLKKYNYIFKNKLFCENNFKF
jgi:hypothetical protein